MFLNPQQLELILDPKHSITIFQSDRARARMGELWKQCGAWLVRLNVLPPNHRWPLAKVSKNRRSKSNFVQCAATAFSKFSKIRLNDLLLRISWPDATVQDLAYALRDGVLLCHTLHIIDPATLDMKQVLTCLLMKMVDGRSNIFVKIILLILLMIR